MELDGSSPYAMEDTGREFLARAPGYMDAEGDGGGGGAARAGGGDVAQPVEGRGRDARGGGSPGASVAEAPSLGQAAAAWKNVAFGEAAPDGAPMWVKWRGKYQAGIKCSSNDCKKATLKAAPTHRAKTYIVVYIPSSGTWLWVSALNVVPIDQDPLPLLAGTHDSGRMFVRDTNIPRYHVMFLLEHEILDISDKLPLQAVQVSARNVRVWQAFAVEAGKSTTYSEVGSLLPKLHAKILPSFISPSWMKDRYSGWKVECESCVSATSVEDLTQELIDKVIWDKVHKLWNTSDQTALTSSEWQNWKAGTLKELRNLSRAVDVILEHLSPSLPGTPSVPSKPKASLGLQHEGGSSSGGLAKEVGDLAGAQPSLLDRQSMADASASTVGGFSFPKSVNESAEQICIGITKHGVRCTHKTKGGALYCGKHVHPGVTSESLDTVTQEDRGQHRTLLAGAQLRQMVEQASSLPEECAKSSELVKTGGTCRGWSKRTNAQCARRAGKYSLYCEKHVRTANDRDSDVLSNKMNNSGFADNGASGLAYQERKDYDRARDLLNNYLAQNLGELAQDGPTFCTKAQKNCQVEGEGLDRILQEASKDLPMALKLSKVAALEQNRLRKETEGWAGETRYAITDLNEFDRGEDAFTAGAAPPTGNSDHDPKAVVPSEPKFSVSEDTLGEPCVVVTAQKAMLHCALCEREFNQNAELSKHWFLQHEEEASRFLKCLSCRNCQFETFSLPVIQSHGQEQHRDLPFENLCWWICVSCDSSFANWEALWHHVSLLHADQLMHRAQAIGGALWKPRQCVLGVHQAIGWKCETPCIEMSTGLFTEYGASVDSSNANGGLEVLGTVSDTQVPSSHNLPTVHRGRSRGRPRGRVRGGDRPRGQSRGTVRSSDFVDGEQEDIIVKRTKLNPSPQGCVMANEKDIGLVKTDQNPLGAIADMAPVPQHRVEQGAAEEETALLDRREGVEVSRDFKPSTWDMEMDGQRVVNGTSLGGGVGHFLWEQELRLSGIIADFRFPSRNAHELQLCEDLSHGLEPLQVPCVVDRDVLDIFFDGPISHDEKQRKILELTSWKNFVYVNKRSLDPSLGIDTKNFQVGCSCPMEKCVPEHCDHVKIFDNDNCAACDLHGRPMHGRFPYDADGRIILQEGFLVYECNSSCHCLEDCQNRILQKGVQVKLQVYKTRHKGWAVRAAESIPLGTFVCEYVGEVLSDKEANKRGERYDQLGCSYLYDIDVHLDTSERASNRVRPYVIDATHNGNVSRFINHSCSPNLVNYQVLVESMDCQLAHIGLYASRDIAVGEELAYDYRYKLLPGKGCPCQCGSANCRGRLY